MQSSKYDNDKFEVRFQVWRIQEKNRWKTFTEVIIYYDEMEMFSIKMMLPTQPGVVAVSQTTEAFDRVAENIYKLTEQDNGIEKWMNKVTEWYNSVESPTVVFL